MKATGIVRRIDDLGRVVIPKEIRRTLRIREGDPLEIFTDREGEVILKKYSPIGELSSFARQYAESLAQTISCLVCVCDMDQIIASAGNGKKDLQDKYISRQLEKQLGDRTQLVAASGEKKYIPIADGQDEEYKYEVISPIICEGDIIGGVILLSKDIKKKLTELEQKMAACAAGFLEARWNSKPDDRYQTKRQERIWNKPGISIISCDRQGGMGMERKLRKDARVMWILKSLLVSYVLTGILLLLLAVALYKLELNEKAVSAAIVAIYIVSTLLGGIIIGKFARVRRYLWGLGLGIGYFALLLLITLGVYHTLNGDAANLVTTFILCAGGGMAGGMLS